MVVVVEKEKERKGNEQQYTSTSTSASNNNNNPNELFDAVEGLRCFLFPLTWHQIYMPVVPLQLRDHLMAPVTYLCGACREDLGEALDALKLDNCVVADLGDDVVLDAIDYLRLRRRRRDAAEAMLVQQVAALRTEEKKAMSQSAALSDDEDEAGEADEECSDDEYLGPDWVCRALVDNDKQQPAAADSRAALPAGSVRIVGGCFDNFRSALRRWRREVRPAVRRLPRAARGRCASTPTKIRTPDAVLRGTARRPRQQQPQAGDRACFPPFTRSRSSADRRSAPLFEVRQRQRAAMILQQQAAATAMNETATTTTTTTATTMQPPQRSSWDVPMPWTSTVWISRLLPPRTAAAAASSIFSGSGSSRSERRRPLLSVRCGSPWHDWCPGARGAAPRRERHAAAGRGARSRRPQRDATAATATLALLLAVLALVLVLVIIIAAPAPVGGRWGATGMLPIVGCRRRCRRRVRARRSSRRRRSDADAPWKGQGVADVLPGSRRLVVVVVDDAPERVEHGAGAGGQAATPFAGDARDARRHPGAVLGGG